MKSLGPAPFAHVGIIPDGGRRWARRMHVDLASSYQRSLRQMRFWLEEAALFGAEEVSIYLLSRQNLGRPREQLDALLSSLPALRETLDDLSVSEVQIVGDLSLLPSEHRDCWERLRTPRSGVGMRLNLLAAYDAWDELAAAGDGKNTMVTIDKLAISRPVDVVLRTAGGHLLSGFLPMQCRYALLSVTEELFNDVAREQVHGMLERAARDPRWLGL